MRVGVQPGRLHQRWLRLRQPGEYHALRDTHERIPRAESVDGVEGGRAPAPHAHVVRLALVHAPGKGDAQLDMIFLCVPRYRASKSFSDPFLIAPAFAVKLSLHCMHCCHVSPPLCFPL